MKALVARALAARVKDGDVLGLGSGSTVELAVDQIGQRVAREGLKVAGVPTSHRIAMIAAKAGIDVLSPVTPVELSWGFDGADEVDPAFNLIKGRGGAMLTEKILAKRVKAFVVIVSEDKLVQKLGMRHPIPVEVIPEATPLVTQLLSTLGAREVVLREATQKYGPVITEHNNVILDAWFDNIHPALEREIKQLTGVVESGLFVGTTREIIVASTTRVYSRTLKDGKVTETALS